MREKINKIRKEETKEEAASRFVSMYRGIPRKHRLALSTSIGTASVLLG